MATVTSIGEDHPVGRLFSVVSFKKECLMAKLNVPRAPEFTHEGAVAVRINAEQELRRSLMANMLWEREFYEEGESNAARIAKLIPHVHPAKVADMAVEARTDMKLRHAPLYVAREMARHASHRGYVKDTLATIIQRADELAEFLAIYWKDGKQPLSAQVKKGLAQAFTKFNEYQLAKYNRDGAVKLRDVLFLCHAKPKDKEQDALWKRLVNNELATPDTWEVNLSAGQDKQSTWERLLAQKKLGALALLRNLRNMEQAGVDRDLVRDIFLTTDFSRVLPFRFIAAAKAAPRYEADIDAAMLRTLEQSTKLPGKTIVVIDVSGSMYGFGNVSKNSDMNRALAACALGAIAREMCENPRIYATAGNDSTRIHKTALVPARRGMALVDAIYAMCRPLGGGGIFLTPVCRHIGELEKNVERMIVITDEQDCATSKTDRPSNAKPLGKPGKNYLINVASYKNGIGYGNWIHIDGWSEAVLNYIRDSERMLQQ
jgi:60 kDa SS-A/Ro ribonucleoprotein